jgi:hypothetical protein
MQAESAFAVWLSVERKEFITTIEMRNAVSPMNVEMQFERTRH